LFRPMTSSVSTFSGLVANSHQALQHVSSSLSKIPYGGFSPVRLQIGLQPQPSPGHRCLSVRPAYPYSVQTYMQLKLLSQKRVCPQHYRRFYHPRAKLNWDSIHCCQRAFQSRGPWLSNGLCCPIRSSLTTASSESVCSFRCLIFFAHRVFALRPHIGWCRRIPQFAPRTCDSVPSSVPRWSRRVHTAVSSPAVLAFATFAQARQPQTHTRRFPCGRVTRLQSSLHATARSLASPSPARAFTTELSPGGSPQPDVGYNYTANSQLPQPDLHRQDTRPYGLQTKTRKQESSKEQDEGSW
jgi:hypothetical protein